MLAKQKIRLTSSAKNVQVSSQLTLGQQDQLCSKFLAELKSSEEQYKVYQVAISRN
ncbi:MAG: hypothetical protein IPK14_16185 [Blastocatellia bacterium]|nr:hypothetical protein [Blastocatellia bacterium]